MGGTIKRKDNPTLNGNTTNEKPKKSNSSPNNSIVNDKRNERDIRENIVLWKNPLTTLEYFIREIGVLSGTYGKKLLENKRNVIIFVISVLFLYILPNINGPQKNLVLATYKKLLWCLYWIGLGILSSVGLGTGLHTFLLYLGPHIARVTLAAYECGSLDFPEPPYPDDIICPSTRGAAAITIWAIMSKVRLECMCWGAGTALGELPPYFMAKAARLSGISDDDELREFAELQQKRKEDMTYIEWGKQFVEEIVRKIGFFGILACASVPNPLFDLAGITCGHFLVPFWTFFGATLIGKAIIKMHIQKLFVIIAFNETLINVALDWLRILPVIGGKLQVPFKSFLDGQKQKLHKNSNIPDSKNFIGTIFDLFVFGMILYFVLSIINSFAQSYHKRITKSKSSKD